MTKHAANAGSPKAREAGSPTVKRLTQEHEAEVLAFLAERPVHTFGMVGYIHANGLVSEHNRGGFYGCRNEDGQLEGVALIGHHILLETRTDAAIEAFAHLAKECRDAHMVLGEHDEVERFWSCYADGGQAPRLFCRELLLEQRELNETLEAVPGLRRAESDDLELIVPAHAQCAFDESGVDPLQVDPEGFRERCARRIERGKTWVWIENGRLLFKADVITDTPLVAYLEGVWVDPQERGNGVGSRCMSELGKDLRTRSGAVCLLVNEKFLAARALYASVGYEFIGCYDTIFLKSEIH